MVADMKELRVQKKVADLWGIQSSSLHYLFKRWAKKTSPKPPATTTLAEVVDKVGKVIGEEFKKEDSQSALSLEGIANALTDLATRVGSLAAHEHENVNLFAKRIETIGKAILLLDVKLGAMQLLFQSHLNKPDPPPGISMPVFPNFDPNWPVLVQLDWLKVWGETLKTLTARVP